ncbi:asparagine synthase-related protein (plasmid) [Halorientalis pallida]|uniref:asparagine synthase-related protein n=1 Tax=Halorientalis pallida TaxID=2479928 RepID=UPI003C6EA940
MPGVAGGVVGGTGLERMRDAMWHESWYENSVVEAGDLGIAHRHHGSKDPMGHTRWRDGQRVGVVAGAITNRDELGFGTETLFDRLFSDSSGLAAELEGPFAVAAADAAENRVVLVTDRLGSRPLYYTDEDPFAFASGLAPLLAVGDGWEIDTQAISDMLLLGHMWGDRTLVEGLTALGPASVLEYDDGEVRTVRYWRPDYDPAPAGEQYVFELAKRFQRAVDRVSQSVEGSAGLWLSGGLDSRMTASELARNRDAGQLGDLYTYTYDSNPPGGVNPRLAERVATELDVHNVRVEVSADRWAQRLEDAVRITDGMIQWHSLLNLSSVFNLSDPAAGVIMEGLEGSLVGHHLHPCHFECDSAVQSLYRSEASRDTDTVTDLLATEVDPLATLREDAARSPMEGLRDVVLDAHYRNYYARVALASNKVARSQVGTRVPYVDSAFIEQSARMPHAFREKTIPFVGGDVPRGIPPAKIKLLRSLNTRLARIPYERTSLPPTYPLSVQVAGFVGTTAWRRLTGGKTHGGPGLNDVWYREHDGLRSLIDGLLDDACERPFFDADAIQEYRDAHLAGDGDHISVLAPITTVECWLQTVYEPQTATATPPKQPSG